MAVTRHGPPRKDAGDGQTESRTNDGPEEREDAHSRPAGRQKGRGPEECRQESAAEDRPEDHRPEGHRPKSDRPKGDRPKGGGTEGDPPEESGKGGGPPHGGEDSAKSRGAEAFATSRR